MKTPNPITVSLNTSDSAAAVLHRSVLASLPRRFVITDKGAGREQADVAVISGREASWIEHFETAVDGGVKGILLVASTAADPNQIRKLRTRDAMVAVDTRFAADPAWAAAIPDIAADAQTVSLIDSVMTVEDSADGALFNNLVEQLAVIRPVVGAFDRLDCIYRSDRQLALVGNVGKAAVSLTVVASPTSGSTLRVDVVSSARRWQANFDDTALAQPTEIITYDCNGAHTRPLLYANGRRAIWMQLHTGITERAKVTYSLEQLATDIEIAQQALTGGFRSITDSSSRL